MDISGLLTSAGINTGFCLVAFALYSVLRKQPSNASVYFGQRLAQLRAKRNNHFSFDRFVPSPSWIVMTWEASEEEILASGGLDAVVFLRIVVFSFVSVIHLLVGVVYCLVIWVVGLPKRAEDSLYEST